MDISWKMTVLRNQNKSGMIASAARERGGAGEAGRAGPERASPSRVILRWSDMATLC